MPCSLNLSTTSQSMRRDWDRGRSSARRGRSFGSPTSAHATARRWRWPPESVSYFACSPSRGGRQGRSKSTSRPLTKNERKSSIVSRMVSLSGRCVCWRTPSRSRSQRSVRLPTLARDLHRAARRRKALQDLTWWSFRRRSAPTGRSTPLPDLEIQARHGHDLVVVMGLSKLLAADR